MGKIPREVFNQHLSSYFHAERKGSELISRLADFAPNDEARAWIPIWAKEEAHHHSMWDRVLQNRQMRPVEMEYNVSRLFQITEDYVNAKSWTGSMVGAAVIEHLSNAVAAYLYHLHRSAMGRIGVKLPGIRFSRGAGFELKKRLIKLLA